MISIRSTLIAAIVAFAPAASAVAQERTEVGSLDCAVAGGVGFIVGSTKEIECVFTPADGGPADRYVGSVSKVGLDIGVTGASVIKWIVVAPSNVAGAAGSLAGTYAGASAEATVGLGLGANVLVGGSRDTIALQPVSIQAQKGLNIAVGIGALTLKPAG